MAGKKVTMAFSEITLKMLDEICGKKGIKKSAAIAIAIEKYYREEENRGNK